LGFSNVYEVKAWLQIALTLIIALGQVALNAQNLGLQNNELLTATFQDSIMAEEKDAYIVNQLSIRNNNNASTLVQVNIDLPTGWQIVSRKSFDITLTPGELYSLAIAMVKLPSATSMWQPVHITMVCSPCGFKKQVEFFISVKELSSVTITPLHKEVILEGKDTKVDLSFTVKNNGNCTDTFGITLRNYYLQIEKTLRIVLAANTDTVINIAQQVSTAQVMASEQNIVHYMVKSRKGGQASENLYILRSASSRKMHDFAYNSMALEVENGIISYDDQISYYGTLKGKYEPGKGRLLDFNYRTRQYGPNSDLQKDVFNINFRTSKTSISAGMISDAKYFFANGRGAKLSHSFRSPVSIYASAIVAESFFRNFGNTYSTGIGYRIGKSTLLHEAAFNDNDYYHTKEIIIGNELTLIKKKDLGLSVKGGVGKKLDSDDIGKSWGYSLEWKNNKLFVLSRLAETDLNFPGLNRGLKNHNHSVRLSFKRLSYGLFYQEYSIFLNPFRDTVYNADALSINSRRMGFSTTLSAKKINYTISVGDLKGTQQSSNIASYKFVEFQSNYNISKAIILQLSSINGYSGEARFKEKPTWFTSSTMLVNTKFGGIRTFYNRVPFLNKDTMEVVDRLVETMNFSPYVTFKLFNSILFSIHYNIFRTLEDNEVSSNINGKLIYRNRTNDINIELTGTTPIKESKSNFFGLSTRFYTLTVKKRFTVPVPFKKKFPTIKMKLYNDYNNNGIMDKDDQAVKDYHLLIGGKLFKTDKNGELEYRHIDTGTYKLVTNQTIKQAVPVGLPQSITLTEDRFINVPFMSSKSITGHITMISDTLSNLKFSPVNIKVTATDSLGLSYSAIADQSGFFVINLPSGEYNVSLNPMAFTSSYKPDVMSYKVNIKDVQTADVSFVIRQQKRQVRFLKTN
jgi:hypothetical protein